MTTSADSLCTAKKVPSSNSGARVVKLVGDDAEFGNSIQGLDSAPSAGTVEDAAKRLLSEINGVEQRTTFDNDWSTAIGPGYLSQADESLWNCPDSVSERSAVVVGQQGNTTVAPSYSGAGHVTEFGHKFLPSNGGKAYIDMNHLEICSPETLSAIDYVAYSAAGHELARNALKNANSRLPEGQRILLLANNSDGLGQSYGFHLNVLISESAYRDIFDTMYPYLFFSCCVSGFKYCHYRPGQSGR